MAMPNKDGGAPDRSFVVVLGARAAARLREHEQLELLGNPNMPGSVHLAFRTRYSDEGFEATVPREMWIEARGPGWSLNEATDRLPQSATSALPIIAVATNAAILDAVLHLAYEDTPGATEREFFQAFVPGDTGLPLDGRPVVTEAVAALAQAIESHPERERLGRAAGQYHAALTNWQPGMETMALAHLYMGMETLTKAYLRQECRTRGLAEDELATAWGIDKKRLDPTVRLRLLFRGDKHCYETAKEASDGFEHGYLDFSHIRTKAVEVRDKTAEYLRSSILDLAQADAEKMAPIRGEPYREVLGAWEPVKYFRGILLGDGPRLAEEGQAYPRVEWSSKIRAFQKAAPGSSDYLVTPQENMKMHLGPGISLRAVSFELWGPKKNPLSPGLDQG